MYHYHLYLKRLQTIILFPVLSAEQQTDASKKSRWCLHIDRLYWYGTDLKFGAKPGVGNTWGGVHERLPGLSSLQKAHQPRRRLYHKGRWWILASGVPPQNMTISEVLNLIWEKGMNRYFTEVSMKTKSYNPCNMDSTMCCTALNGCTTKFLQIPPSMP